MFKKISNYEKVRAEMDELWDLFEDLSGIMGYRILGRNYLKSCIRRKGKKETENGII